MLMELEMEVIFDQPKHARQLLLILTFKREMWNWFPSGTEVGHSISHPLNLDMIVVVVVVVVRLRFVSQILFVSEASHGYTSAMTQCKCQTCDGQIHFLSDQETTWKFRIFHPTFISDDNLNDVRMPRFPNFMYI